MSAEVPDAIMDLLLAGVATADQMDITSDITTPVNLTNTLATVAMTPGDGNDYTIAAGDIDGRKVTMAQKSGIPITGAGTQNALHVILSLSTVIIDITTCTSQPLTNGGTVTAPAWDHTVRQAA